MDEMKVKGTVVIEVFDRKTGEVKDRRVIRNMVVDTGKEGVTGLLTGIRTTAFTYMAVGTGTTTPSGSDTTLESEVSRVSATTSQETTTTTNDTAVWKADFTFSSNYTITEAGIFDADTGGTMLARTTFTGINVDSNTGISITWKIQVS